MNCKKLSISGCTSASKDWFHKDIWKITKTLTLGASTSNMLKYNLDTAHIHGCISDPCNSHIMPCLSPIYMW